MQEVSVIMLTKNSERGCKVSGIDLSEDRIEMAESLGRPYDCQFQIGNAEKLPFEAGIFDKMVSVCSLEHFDNDDRALAEMNRVLKNDGTLVLSVDSFTYASIKKEIQDKALFTNS